MLGPNDDTKCIPKFWQHHSHWYHLHSPSLKAKQFRTSFCEGAVPLVKSKILMILPSCHLSSIPGKFLCMLVQNGCLDSQQVHVFAHVKKSVFAKKNQKWCNFWAPKTGAHFWTYNLQLQSNFLLKWYGAPKMGPKNGTQKWCPKKWKNVGRSIEKLLRESCCIDMQSQPWIVYLAVW